jgi:hypothetical protein
LKEFPSVNIVENLGENLKARFESGFGASGEDLYLLVRILLYAKKIIFSGYVSNMKLKAVLKPFRYKNDM